MTDKNNFLEDVESEIDIELDEQNTVDENIAEENKEMSETSLSYYMQRIGGSTPLSREREQELGRLIRAGNQEAVNELISANLKFVIKVAYKFKNFGLPMSDIINQGNLGLVEAARRFDPEKNVKFISYAVWWIRQYIVQGIAEQSGTVKLPIKQAGNLFKISSAKSKLMQENGRDVSDEEIAEYLGLNGEDVSDILRVSKGALSLESSIKDGEDKTFADYLTAETDSAEEVIIQRNMENIVEELINELDEREKNIIQMRFGFENDENLTLDEIGKKMGVSRERIRQLENRALDKLKKKAYKKGLQYYAAV